MPALALVHAAMAAVLLGTSLLPVAARIALARIASIVGVCAGLWLAASGDPVETWRATSLSTGPVVVAGVAVAAAWLLAAALEDGEGRWEVGAAVGVGSTGLILLATGGWTVPALLSFVVVVLAVAVGVVRGPHRYWVWLQAGIGGTLVAAGWVLEQARSDSWVLSARTGGAGFWITVVGASILAGAVPVVGVWRTTARPEAALTPLAVATGLVVIALTGQRMQPWLALGALLLALLAVAPAAFRSTSRDGLGPWAVALALAAAFAGALVVPATVMAVIAASTASLGRVDRVTRLAATMLPSSIGVVVVTAAAAAAFDAATHAEGITESVPWVSVAAAIPLVAIAGAIVIPSAPGTPRLAGWALGLLALLFGAFPVDLAQTETSPLGAQGGVLALSLAALALGVAAAYLIGPGREATPDATVASDVSDDRMRGLQIRPLWGWVGAATLGLMVVTALWLTYQGLKVGFL